MRIVRFLACAILVVCFTHPSLASGYWLWSSAEGKFVSPEGVSRRTAEEQYDYALQLREKGEKDKMVKSLKALVAEYPQSPVAPRAQFAIALVYEEEGDLGKAAEAFQKLIRDFSHSDQNEEAYEHLFRIGNLFLEGGKQKLLGIPIIPVIPKAQEIFQFIVDSAPYGTYGDQSLLRLSLAYRKMGKLSDAVHALEKLIENYPDSPLVDEAHYELAETSYALSQAANQDQLVRQEAAQHLDSFLNQYGTSSLAERARILQRELNEQDAEKNYRIALYYEEKGFAESATIYYEDVIQRYPDTVFGKKASGRLRSMVEPTRILSQTEDTKERRIAEIDSMIETLRREEKSNAKGKQALLEANQLRAQLESEKKLLLHVHELRSEQEREKYESKVKALKEREKNLKEKFSTFEHRRKRWSKEHPSAELDPVFQKWETSLREEQGELREERERLKPSGAAVGGGNKRIALDWIPFVGASGKSARPVTEKVWFEDNKWQKLVDSRAGVRAKREEYEKQLDQLTSQMFDLRKKEFALAKNLAIFNERIPDALKEEKRVLEEQQAEESRLKTSFEQARDAYRKTYGDPFLASLGTSSQTGALSDELTGLTAQELEQKLQALHEERAARAGTWLAQRKDVTTIAAAQGESQKKDVLANLEKVLSFQSLSPEEKVQQTRLLKKRMKFLEREIRSRLEQIHDWEKENAERANRLEQLLHPKEDISLIQKSTGAFLKPFSGAAKLGKSFLFGLPDKERDLVLEAEEVVAGKKGNYSSDATQHVRSLLEEIVLQSILIQGRAKEVVELEQDFNKLRELSGRIPRFSYQSMLVRPPASEIRYSLASADKMLEVQDRQAVYAERLEEKKRELNRVEGELLEIEKKILSAVAALKQTKQAEVEEKAKVAVSVSGTTETLPTQTEEVDEREQLESELKTLKEQSDQAISAEKRMAADFEDHLFRWYQDEAWQEITSQFSEQDRELLLAQAKLNDEREKLNQQFLLHVRNEYDILVSQKVLLDLKLAELEQKVQDFSEKTSAIMDALTDQMKQVRTFRESVVRDLSTLAGFLKSN